MSGPIPHLYRVKDAAPLLRMSEDFLRSKLRDRTYAGVKLAGRWYMTEEQIRAVIDAASTVARPPDPPSPTGLSKRSRFARQARMKAGLQ